MTSTPMFVNGAAMLNVLGIDDKSKRALPYVPPRVPTHFPHFYIYAQKGPTAPIPVASENLKAIYGEDTFNLRKKFATHQTVLIEELRKLSLAEGLQMIERVVPADAGPESNVTLFLELTEGQVPLYETDPATGDYVYDEDDALVPLEVNGVPQTTLGYTGRWVFKVLSTQSDLATKFGAEAIVTVSPTVKQYPFIGFKASSQGEIFNLSGVRLWAPSQAQGLDQALMDEIGAYPLRLSVINRPNARSSAAVVKTLAGEPYIDFTLKPNTLVESLNNLPFTLDKRFLASYTNFDDPAYPVTYGDFGQVVVYQAAIAQALEAIRVLEAPKASAFSDITADGTSDQRWLINPFTARSARGAPYVTFQLPADRRLAEDVNIFAGGGSDGTLSETDPIIGFPALVSERVKAYADLNSVLQEASRYDTSVIYDTGFPMATKYDLLSVLASPRKDIGVILSPYEVGGGKLTATQEAARAAMLRTKAQNYPESNYFGTPVVRAVIVGCNGILRGSDYAHRLPLTIEVAVKAARMMGAGDGRWVQAAVFDTAPNNLVELFTDINLTFVPASTKIKNWDACLNWVEAYDMKSYQIPFLKTVYEDDTSVLNSIFAMFGCIELQKVGRRVYKEVVGNVQRTEAQLVEKANAETMKRVNGRFAGLFKIVSDAYVSDLDRQRGYAYSHRIKMYANNMTTVGSLALEVYRMADAPAEATA